MSSESGDSLVVNVEEVNNNNTSAPKKPKQYRAPQILYDLMDEEIRFQYRRLTQSKYADRLSPGPMPYLNFNKVPSTQNHKYEEPWYAQAKAEHKALIKPKPKSPTKKPMSITDIIKYWNLNGDKPKAKKRKHRANGAARCFEYKRRRTQNP